MVVPFGDHLRIYQIATWETLETKLLEFMLKAWEHKKVIRYCIGGAVEGMTKGNSITCVPEFARQQTGLRKKILLNLYQVLLLS